MNSLLPRREDLRKEVAMMAGRGAEFPSGRSARFAASGSENGVVGLSWGRFRVDTTASCQTLENAQVDVCFGARCWTMPGTIESWKHGEEKQVQLQLQPELLCYLRLGLPVRIEIGSRD